MMQVTENLWSWFAAFGGVAVLLWWVGAWFAWQRRRGLAIAATVTGVASLGLFIALMWIVLERPPMRTMGETRLWYSLFLPVVGLIVYGRHRYRWILSFSSLMATVFVMINLLKPEIHSKTLMPALQSPWFAPHVIVYMFAYALLGAATLAAIYLLLKHRTRGEDLHLCDELVNNGLAFLTIGMLMGALWAKEAWGHYWAWDPKETWAAITWFAYLIYLHARIRNRNQGGSWLLWWLVVSFALMQMCWWGINFLPSAQATSVHTYSM